MNSAGRILLIVGAIVLAFLVGVVVGRHHQADNPADPAASSVQISTQAPPAPLPAPGGKLPTIEPPPPAPVAKVDPNAQVNEDAAAVGMTTRDAPDAPAAPTPREAPQPDDAPPT